MERRYRSMLIDTNQQRIGGSIIHSLTGASPRTLQLSSPVSTAPAAATMLIVKAIVRLEACRICSVTPSFRFSRPVRRPFSQACLASSAVLKDRPAARNGNADYRSNDSIRHCVGPQQPPRPCLCAGFSPVMIHMPVPIRLKD